ncbi:MAG: type III-B CRISPR module RAMP protein Cmr6 [Gallionella sp.]
MLPLYKEAKLAGNLKDDAHRGLWWSRFFNKFGFDFSKPDVGGKGEFISEICKKDCGDADELTANALRQVSLCTALGGVHSCYQTQGRFVTGMGNDHPTENGFTWHPTLGVPYLPASSVKGLVRGWLEWQWGAEALKKDGDAQKRKQLLQWFGSEHKDPREQLAEHQAGWFIFFDALPTAPVTLAADVMTPHYGKWYEQGGDETKNTNADSVPADWHSPVPVTFLTVKKATFQFGIAVRAGLKANDQTAAKTALHEVMAVLQDALEWAGAGAKTATGYGRMEVDEKANKESARLREVEEGKQQEQQRLLSLQTLSPNQRVIEELRIKIEKQTGIAKIPKGNALWTEIKKLALEQTSDWETVEKIVLADMLQEKLPALMSGIDAKDIRKELKLNALRGLV